MKNETFISPKVSKKAINEMFSSYDRLHEIHALQIYHGDELLVSIAPDPYSVKDKREIYSLSKSFTSTAIGVLCDEGKLSVEDRIADIFPEYKPKYPSEFMSRMKLKHVLSMNTGHECCVMNNMIHADDAVRGFFDVEVKYEPGTHFVYNTGATLLLSCIVTKITGMKLLDFLDMKVFRYIGINGVGWNRVKSGQNEGGCGLQASVEDISKLGKLYLNKGVFNGRRILSEEWCNVATSKVSENGNNPASSWGSGYGYQFWRNAYEGYRGDGAFGQLCLIFPERKMYFAVEAEFFDIAIEIDVLRKLACEMFDKGETDEEFVMPEFGAYGSERTTTGYEGRVYRLEENIIGWTQLRVEYSEAGKSMRAILSDGRMQHVIDAGNGYMLESEVYLSHFRPKLTGLMLSDDVEKCRLASSYYVTDEGKMVFSLRHLSCPHRAEMVFEFNDDGVVLTYQCGGMTPIGVEPIKGSEIH